MAGTALARAGGIDPSYLHRLERGQREPPGRTLSLALALGLGLAAPDTDALLAAAGHLPESIERLGILDPTLLLVASILSDAAIPAAERDGLRQIIRLAAHRWRPEA